MKKGVRRANQANGRQLFQAAVSLMLYVIVFVQVALSRKPQSDHRVNRVSGLMLANHTSISTVREKHYLVVEWFEAATILSLFMTMCANL